MILAFVVALFGAGLLAAMSAVAEHAGRERP